MSGGSGEEGGDSSELRNRDSSQRLRKRYTERVEKRRRRAQPRRELARDSFRAAPERIFLALHRIQIRFLIVTCVVQDSARSYAEQLQLAVMIL